jgi:hypothetical protein
MRANMSETTGPVRLKDLEVSKYADEREALSSGINFDKYMTTDSLLEEAKKSNEYSKLLTVEYDRIKADVNKDGKIDQTEYNTYIIEKTEKQLPTLRQNIQENINQNSYQNQNHNYYHFDYTLLIAIGMICLTVIIKSVLTTFKKN